MRESGCRGDGQLNLLNQCADYCQKSEQVAAWKRNDAQGKLVVNAPARERETSQIFIRMFPGRRFSIKTMKLKHLLRHAKVHSVGRRSFLASECHCARPWWGLLGLCK